jgi:DNA-binding NarL/FixJ family response regulator
LLLRKHPDWTIIGEVSDGVEAVQKAHELKPDLVLLDLNLPRLNGVEAANRIRRTAPAAKIVFITAYCDSDAMQTVSPNEAKGYVLKWDITRELLPAVEAVLRGGRFVSTQLSDPGSCGLVISRRGELGINPSYR